MAYNNIQMVKHFVDHYLHSLATNIACNLSNTIVFLNLVTNAFCN